MERMFNYFIPDDGDSSEHLNVFPLPQEVKDLRLEDVEKIFPLPGKFHFRFKKSFEGTYVWLDLTSKDSPVPKYNGLIMCKVSRVAEAPPPVAKQQQQQQKRPSIKPPSPAKVEDLIETSPDSPKSTAKKEKSDEFNNDLVGLMSEPNVSVHPPPSTAPPPPRPLAVDPFSVFHENKTPSNSNSPLQSPAPPPMQQRNNYQGAPYGGMNSMPGPGRPMSMNQMGMNRNQQPPGANFHPTNTNFQGLQWQGMGNQPQQRSGTPPPRGARQNW